MVHDIMHWIYIIVQYVTCSIPVGQETQHIFLNRTRIRNNILHIFRNFILSLIVILKQNIMGCINIFDSPYSFLVTLFYERRKSKNGTMFSSLLTLLGYK